MVRTWLLVVLGFLGTMQVALLGSMVLLGLSAPPVRGAAAAMMPDFSDVEVPDEPLTPAEMWELR